MCSMEYFHHFLSTPYAFKQCNCCLYATLGMVCTLIVLTLVFTESILLLKTQRKRTEISFVSSLNSSVTRSLWIVEKTYPVKLYQARDSQSNIFIYIFIYMLYIYMYIYILIKTEYTVIFKFKNFLNFTTLFFLLQVFTNKYG